MANMWQQELAEQALRLVPSLGRQPGLAVIVVGSRPDSLLYVKRKQEACEQVWRYTSLFLVPAMFQTGPVAQSAGCVFIAQCPALLRSFQGNKQLLVCMMSYGLTRLVVVC